MKVKNFDKLVGFIDELININEQGVIAIVNLRTTKRTLLQLKAKFLERTKEE